MARSTFRRLSLLAATLPAAALLATSAQAASVGLGTTDSFSVLGGSAVTNTGPSVLSGDLGVAPSNAITGFPPGRVGGALHANDAVAQQAKSDLVTAFDDAAGRSTTATVAGDLAGRTLTGGVYSAATSLGLSGTLVLDGQGDPDSVFVFQAGSTLTTAAGSRVQLIGGAQACNVFWLVGSSATIGSATTFTGTILALTSISLTTGATVDGRALARNGAVTLDTNTFTRSTCTRGTGGTGGSGGTGGTGGTTGGTPTTPGRTGGTGPTGTPGGSGGTGTRGADPDTTAAPTPRGTVAVTTGPARQVGPDTARLRGTIRPGPTGTTFRFRFGTRALDRASAPGRLASGARRVPVSVRVRNLRPNTTYRFRLVTTTPGGAVTRGPERRFTTGPPATPALSPPTLARPPRTPQGFTG